MKLMRSRNFTFGVSALNLILAGVSFTSGEFWFGIICIFAFLLSLFTALTMREGA